MSGGRGGGTRDLRGGRSDDRDRGGGRLRARVCVLLLAVVAPGGALMYVGKPLSLNNHLQRQAAVKAKYEARRQKIQKRRTDATVASLGKTAVESQAILMKLQKDLAAV